MTSKGVKWESFLQRWCTWCLPVLLPPLLLLTIAATGNSAESPDSFVAQSSDWREDLIFSLNRKERANGRRGTMGLSRAPNCRKVPGLLWREKSWQFQNDRITEIPGRCLEHQRNLTHSRPTKMPQKRN